MQKFSKPNRNSDPERDIVDEASEESFPASDPPAWANGQRYPAQTEQAPHPPDGDPNGETRNASDQSLGL